MTTSEIFRSLENNNEAYVPGCASHYFVNEEENVVVRVSDHLPKVDNILSNNEGCEMYFIFSSNILEHQTEEEVDSYIESIEEDLNENNITLSNYSVVVAEKEEDLYCAKKVI